MKTAKRKPSVQFDGVNDYIEVSYDKTLDCEDSISIAVWAKSDILSSEYLTIGIIVQMGQGTEAAYAIILNKSVDALQFYFCFHWDENSSTDGILTSAARDAIIINDAVNAVDTLDTRWHFYAFTFDGEAMHAYVDNTYIGSKTTIAGPIADGFSLCVGA